MTNRFPLIANSSVNQIQELPSGDFLDLSNSGISNSGNISVSGVVSATGNIVGNYIIGNGSQLTGLPAGYANSNVTSYAQAGWAGNIIPSVGNTYTLGNATNYWQEIFVGPSSLYIGGNALSAVNGVLAFNNSNVVTTTAPSGTISVAGNITGSNVTTGGQVSAIGNITGSYIIGNGSQLTGLPAGYTNANLASLGANVISTSGNITGGNITGSYILGNGSQLTGLPAGYTNANLGSLGANVISTSGNITGGNIIGNGSALTSLYTTAATTTAATANSIYTLTGTSTPVQILTGTSVSNTIVRLPDTTTCTLGQNFTILNKISGANTTLQFSNTGNITTALGGNIFVTATVVDTSITNGWSFAYMGNSFTGTGGQLVYSQSPNFGTIFPSSIDTGGGGTLTVCQSSATLSFGGSAVAQTINFWPTATANTAFTRTVNLATTANSVSNLSVNFGPNTVTATSAFTVNAGMTVSIANTSGTALSVVGNITGGNLSVGTGTITGGNIVNSNANGVGNIGSATTYFNTVFAKATSAQYADLAEMYCADDNYVPGTVVEFGGTHEITISITSHSTCVAGIISTDPSYLMNSALECANALEVALVGRVPCQVVGTIRKGDRLVASNLPGVATRLDMKYYEPGCIIGKALEDYDSVATGIIEVAVGRF